MSGIRLVSEDIEGMKGPELCQDSMGVRSTHARVV